MTTMHTTTSLILRSELFISLLLVLTFICPEHRGAAISPIPLHIHDSRGLRLNAVSYSAPNIGERTSCRGELRTARHIQTAEIAGDSVRASELDVAEISEDASTGTISRDDAVRFKVNR